MIKKIHILPLGNKSFYDIIRIVMKNFLKYFISMVLACFTTCSVYNFLGKYIHYRNLHDFYIGVSIFEDFDKYFDLSMFLVYIISFFVIYFLLPKFNFVIKIPKLKFPKISINKTFEKCLLYMGVLGYISLYPMNGIFYPKMFLLILLLMGISIFNICKDNEYKYFAYGSFIIMLFGQNYNIGIQTLDLHHFGEMVSPFYLNHMEHFQYYKDTMLVHGFCDILPSIFSLFLFKTNSLNGFFMGRVLYINMTVLFTYYLAVFVFNNCKYYILPIFLFPITLIQPMFLSFLAIIKMLKKPALALFSQIILSVFFMLIWTTCGTFYTLATLPLVIYLVYKLIKDKKYFKVFINIFILFVTCYILKDFIYNYMEKAQFYIQGNLFGFGNNFPLIKVRELKGTFVKLFMYIIWAPLLLCFINEFKKGISRERVFAYAFILLFPIFTLNYSFGRLDAIIFGRIRYFSFAYLTIFVPFLLVKTENIKTLWKILGLIVLLFSIFTFSNPFLYKAFSFEDEGQCQRIKVLQKFFETKKNVEVLDLANNGMLYYLIKQKSAIPYTSFYNVITTSQAEHAMKKLPDFVIIKSVSLYPYDNIYPSLRVTPIYKKILLSGKYRMIKLDDVVLLEKVEKARDFNKKEKVILDKTLSSNYIQKLPITWGRSKGSLPLSEVSIKFKVNIRNNQTIITLETPICGKDVDLISFVAHKKFSYVQVNSDSTKLYFDGGEGLEELLPLNSVPSFLLSEIKEITVDGRIENVKFYRRISLKK